MPGCPSNAILSGNFSAGYQTALRLLSQTINTPTTVAGFNLWYAVYSPRTKVTIIPTYWNISQRTGVIRRRARQLI
jgi:hypothetical protein